MPAPTTLPSVPQLDPTSALLIYGPLGIVVALFVIGLIVSKSSHDYVKGLLAASLDRESKLADALGENTTTLRELAAELRSRKTAGR